MEQKISPEMQEKIKALQGYLKHAEGWNVWRKEAMHRLLTDIGPRIAKLDTVMYMGCGFHYAMENSFGKLVCSLIYPLQPCMNHFDKCKDKWIEATFSKVLFDGLIKDVEKAEKSAIEFAKKS